MATSFAILLSSDGDKHRGKFFGNLEKAVGDRLSAFFRLSAVSYRPSAERWVTRCWSLELGH